MLNIIRNKIIRILKALGASGITKIVAIELYADTTKLI